MRDLTISIVPRSEFETRTSFSNQERVILKDLLNDLVWHLDEIEKILKDSILSHDLPIQQASAQLSKFYDEVLIPAEFDIRRMYSEVDPREFTLSILGKEHKVRLNPPPIKRNHLSPDEILIDQEVTGLIQDALDIYETEIQWSDTRYDEDDIDKARSVVTAPFFKPNHWLSNIELIKPVLSGNIDAIPWHVKLRLKEIYQSFLFGNWMAVFSLSRSVLEYSLINRSSSLGFDAYKVNNDGSRGEAWGVRELVRRATEKLDNPEISHAMDKIVERGNWVMHPKKKDKLIQSPLTLRNYALECVMYLRDVVSELYERR